MKQFLSRYWHRAWASWCVAMGSRGLELLLTAGGLPQQGSFSHHSEGGSTGLGVKGDLAQARVQPRRSAAARTGEDAAFLEAFGV